MQVIGAASDDWRKILNPHNRTPRPHPCSKRSGILFSRIRWYIQISAQPLVSNLQRGAQREEGEEEGEEEGKGEGEGEGEGGEGEGGEGEGEGEVVRCGQLYNTGRHANLLFALHRVHIRECSVHRACPIGWTS